MANIYERRWQAARKWFEDFLQRAKDNGCTHFRHDGKFLLLECLQINEKGIYVVDRVAHERCTYTYIIFENDIELDHGLHTKIEESLATFKNNFKLFKEV